MISNEEAIAIAERIENSDIDIKRTIEKAVTAGYLGEDQSYCTVMQNGDFTYLVSDILGENYPRVELGNLYFDVISKALDDKGIYISLAYCSSDLRVSDDFVDEVIEYDDYELEEDDLYFLREFVLITSDSTRVFKIYEEEGISGHKSTEDIGLLVNYEDGVYSYFFALRFADLCGASLKVFKFSEDYPLEHELSFKNPINRLLVEMISDVIVFNE